MEIEDSKMTLKMEPVTKVKLFVVVGIPAFNEEKTIARVVLESQNYAGKVVVCDDGSADLTPVIAEKLGAIVIRHERNQGYGSAIQSLFQHARSLNADILVTVDGDGQHEPEEIPQVIKPIIEGVADVVVGSRLIDKRLSVAMPWYRRAGVKLLTKLTNGQNAQNRVKDAQSGFRAYNRKSIEELVVFENGMGVSSEILINARKQRLRIYEVSASCNYHNGVRTSTRNPVRHGIDVVASIIKLVIEDRPLMMLGLPGIVCLAIGTLFGVWLLQIYALEHHVVTNIALASIAFIMTGFFALSTAITLYAIKRAINKIRN